MAKKSRSKRLDASEIDKRAVIKLSKVVKASDEGVHGLMTFGENNDYPQTMELAINGSVTAKAAAGTYSNFLAGEGFTNEALNDVVVGRDQRGQEVTLHSLLQEVGDSVSMHYGFYIHRNTNAKGETDTVHLKPFKNGRFAKPDDTGYSAKILFYDNWGKDTDLGKYNAKDAVAYSMFNNDERVIVEQIKRDGGVDKFKGQIFFQFFDRSYFYPLSPFDAAYLDVDTEQQLALYKNRQLRNGFFDKILVRVQPGVETEEDGSTTTDGGIKDELAEFLGPNGETVMVIEDDIDPDTNEFYKNSFQIEHVSGNVSSKLFENWEKGLANNIRKSIRNIPAVLIDYEESKLGTTSGEAIIQATNFYNALTQKDRDLISKAFKEIFSRSTNTTLRDNKDWSIKPLQLVPEGEGVDEAEDKRLESQAALKGSVVGVTALVGLQQAVSQGTADVDSAVEIVKQIYGFDEATAQKLVGTPKPIDDGATS